MNIKEILEESDPTIQFRFSKEKPKRYFSIVYRRKEHSMMALQIVFLTDGIFAPVSKIPSVNAMQ